MTEPQMQKFIARWNRLLMSRKERTPAEVVHQLQQRMIILTVTSCLFLFANSFRASTSYFWQTMEIIFFLLLCFSFWMTFRLLQARRILDKSQIVNRKS
jgi:hypothetical protein